MSLRPLPYVYEGNGVFRAMGRHALAVVQEQCGQGQVVRLMEQEERSEVSHNHMFAWLAEAWRNLPPHLIDAYPSVEHLRKAALIATGFCTTTDYVCGTNAEAQRWAANLRREVSDYDVVEVRAGVVRVHRARSQKRGAMDKAEFQAAKEAVLGWVANLLGVEPDQLQNARAA